MERRGLILFYSTICLFGGTVLPYVRRCIQGHPKFSKKAKALSKVVEGRSLHSVPLAFWSISQKSQFISSGATRKFCDISWNFLREPGAGRLGKDCVKNKKQAPEPLGGGACVFDFCVVLLYFLVCPWI